MLLKAHATPALPRCPVSAAPLASNALPAQEIFDLQVEVGLQVVGGYAEAVDVKVAVACAVAEVDADD